MGNKIKTKSIILHQIKKLLFRERNYHKAEKEIEQLGENIYTSYILKGVYTQNKALT